MPVDETAVKVASHELQPLDDVPGEDLAKYDVSAEVASGVEVAGIELPCF